MTVPNLYYVLLIGLSASWVVSLKVVTSDVKSQMEDCVQSYAKELDKLNLSYHAQLMQQHPLRTVSTSKRSVIIGAGMGTTGTKSLKAALKLLGYDVWHAGQSSTWDERRLPVRQFLQHGEYLSLRQFDFVKMLDGVDGAIDTPTAEIFIDLFLSFPNAKVVLSTRPSREWAAKRLKVHPNTLLPAQEPFGLYLDERFYGINEVAQIYEANNDFVRCVVPKGQLVEYDLWADSKERIHGLLNELHQLTGRTAAPSSGPFPVVRGKGVVHVRGDAVRVVDIDTGEACEAGDMNLTGQIDVASFGTLMQEQAQRNCEIVIDGPIAQFEGR